MAQLVKRLTDAGSSNSLFSFGFSSSTFSSCQFLAEELPLNIYNEFSVLFANCQFWYPQYWHGHFFLLGIMVLFTFTALPSIGWG